MNQDLMNNYVMHMTTIFWGKKWRKEVMHALKDEPLRFSELKLKLPKCSVKVLSEVLVELTRNHLVTRVQHDTMPVKVYYHINPDLVEAITMQQDYFDAVAKFLLKNRDLYHISNDMVSLLERYCQETN